MAASRARTAGFRGRQSCRPITKSGRDYSAFSPCECTHGFVGLTTFCGSARVEGPGTGVGVTGVGAGVWTFCPDGVGVGGSAMATAGLLQVRRRRNEVSVVAGNLSRAERRKWRRGGAHMNGSRARNCGNDDQPRRRRGCCSRKLVTKINSRRLRYCCHTRSFPPDRRCQNRPPFSLPSSCSSDHSAA